MFRFAHPGLLYLLAVIPLLVLFYVVMRHRKKKAIAEFGNPELLAPLMPLLSFRRGAWKIVMILLALFFVIVGAAGPQFGSKLQQVKKKGVELMIVLDVSNSMMAQDIKPSRLEKAKLAISRMIEKLSNDKVGMIVFAGDAYVQLPITTDYSSARLFLSGINTDIVPVQGTAIGAAINTAMKSFTPETETSKAIIVITDGENHQDGNPGQFMKDGRGNVIVSKLDEATLREVAEAGEGLYVRASNTDVGLNTLLDEVNKMDKSLLEERIYSDYAEKYQYFLLAGLFFVFVEFMILGRKNRHFMKINIFKEESRKADR